MDTDDTDKDGESASRKVRPYNESFAAPIGLGSGSIRVHPWFNDRFSESSQLDPQGRRTHTREYDNKVERANCRAAPSERSSSRFSIFWRSIFAMRSP